MFQCLWAPLPYLRGTTGLYTGLWGKSRGQKAGSRASFLFLCPQRCSWGHWNSGPCTQLSSEISKLLLRHKFVLLMLGAFLHLKKFLHCNF